MYELAHFYDSSNQLIVDYQLTAVSFRPFRVGSITQDATQMSVSCQQLTQGEAGKSSVIGLTEQGSPLSRVVTVSMCSEET
jgi:hypothetical protein